MNRSPLLFVHIPKTAGTSLKSLLCTRFDQAAILEVSEGWPQWSQLVDRVDACELIAGHVGYGFVNAFQRRPNIVTFLRDPVERAVSAYYFLRQIDDSTYAKYPHEERCKREHAARRAKELSLLDFIRFEPQIAAAHLGNVQTWYLSSTEIRRRPYCELRSDDLPHAVQNLERCTCIGLVERLDESMELLSQSLEWEPFARLPHANSTRTRPAVNDLDPATIDSLRELTQLDGELYRFATRLFERRRQAMLIERPFKDLRGPLGASRTIPARAAGENLVFTFDRVVPGGGWYGAERVADRWCSWTGPNREAWLNLETLPRQAAVLRVRIVHALRAEVLHGSQLLINDEPLAPHVRHEPDGFILEASIPTSLTANGGKPARIVIRVPEVLRPCDLDPTNADSRRLGLLVAAISLTPAA